jgi:hypothetical protein
MHQLGIARNEGLVETMEILTEERSYNREVRDFFSRLQKPDPASTAEGLS